MITDEQRADLRALIERNIAELEVSIPRMREQMAPVAPDSAIGRLSRTDSMMNAGTVGLALKDAQARLTRLRNRLERIDDPEIDRCSICRKELGLQRLFAVPDRGMCTDCLSKATKKR